MKNYFSVINNKDISQFSFAQSNESGVHPLEQKYSLKLKRIHILNHNRH